jgi:TonB family protein
MAEISQRLPFSQLETNQSRKGPFGTSFVVQAIAVAVLLSIRLAAPQILEKKRYETIELTAPVEQAKLSPAPKVKVVQPKVKVEPTPVPQQVKITPPPMPTRIPKPAPVVEAKIEAPAPKFESKRLDLPPGPKPAKPIHIDNFGSSGSSATPTLANKNASEVQTGGFGDPNGVPASDNRTGKVAIAKLGSFDLPEGAGQGNGTGGGRGAKGTVVSSGFGNGTAVQGGGGRGAGGGNGSGRVVQTAFAAPVAAEPSATRKTVAEDSGFTPFTILSKPKPTYSDEGRKRHIEGEVQLDVVFMANGQIKVLGVTRGLGYGLDEAAIQAAQKIQFVPAKRGGQPVDYQAKLRILFQLT